MQSPARALSDQTRFVYEKIACEELRLEPRGSGCVALSFGFPVDIVACVIPESEATNVVITAFRVGETELLDLPFDVMSAAASLEVSLKPGEPLRIDFVNAKRRVVRVRPSVVIRRLRRGLWN